MYFKGLNNNFLILYMKGKQTETLVNYNKKYVCM